VLADALIDAGDPRGELVSLMLAHEETVVAELLERRRDRFWGPLAEYKPSEEWPTTFRWRHGYIHAGRLAHSPIDSSARGRVAEAVETLLLHPSGRFLVELAIGINGAEAGRGWRRNLDEIVPLLARHAPPTLRVLHLGDFTYPSESDISAYDIGDISPLWPSLMRLRKLIVQGAQIGLGELELPSLEHLEIRTGGLPSGAARSIARAVLPSVRQLEIWFGSPSYSGRATLDDIRPLLAREDLPALESLGLRNAVFTDRLCAALIDSPLLRQLRRLDLSMGCMTDEGARRLASNGPAVARLERLEVSDNYLTDAGLGRLEARLGARQRQPEGR
jgi:hypothetical protein